MNAGGQQEALTVAERLLAIDAVLATIQTSTAATLAHGLAGTALLHARLSTLGPLFAKAAVTHWTEAARQARLGSAASAGIYHAPGGLAASLIIGTPYLPDPDTQRAAVVRAVRWASARAIELAEHHRGYLAAGGVGTPQCVYDVITGIAGIGRVLLAAVQSGHNDAERGLVAALDMLTTMVHTRYDARPGWWLSPSEHPSTVNVHPSGAANTGMAHGIAGPLALLASAYKARYSVAGQKAAIRDAANWLLHWRTGGVGIWPPLVTGDELNSGIAAPVPGRCDAWCYGIPGISRSLHLAGQAIDDAHLKVAAADAVSVLAQRPPAQWDVEGPTLCHGYAGVLQSIAAANATVAERAAARVAASFDPSYRFSFQHTDGNAVSDQPGFLVGAAGVALALAEHAGVLGRDVPTRWDALLLLS